MPEKEKYELDIKDLDKKNKEDLEKILKYIEKYSEYERNRLKNIQSKASLYIGAFSISITILSIFINNILTSTVNSNISNENIITIRITNYTDLHGNIINKKNWKEIYEYIKQL